MSIDIELRGAEGMRRAARALREADRRLQPRIARGLREVGERFVREVRAGAPRYVPSGYAPTLTAALNVSMSMRRGGISFRVYAPGQSQQRDVRSIDAGLLRHPVFGHRDRWAAQRVRPGLVEDPRRRLAERAYDEIVAAVEEAVAEATRG